MIKRTFALLILLTLAHSALAVEAATSDEGTLIQRSMSERANYYLISIEPDGKYKKTTHLRASSMSRGYSITRIDCASQRYQDLGYGEDSRINIKMYDKGVKWTELVRGSSKSDLVNFVCK